jgi:hypothetical protein
MYNVEKLEQQWLRYRRKKILLPVVSALVGIALLGAIVYYTGSDRFLLDDNGSSSTVTAANTTMPSHNLGEDPAVGKLSTLATEVPSLGDTPKSDRPKAGQIIFQDSEEATAGQRTKKRKNLLIQVTERGGKDIAVDIENRFEFAKDKSDSLFLAKYYYDKMEYAKAEKWALETNKLDNAIEESWLIFAKAQAKQGKRIASLKVLKAFFDQSGSTKAKILMDRIRRGKNF